MIINLTNKAYWINKCQRIVDEVENIRKNKLEKIEKERASQNWIQRCFSSESYEWRTIYASCYANRLYYTSRNLLNALRDDNVDSVNLSEEEYDQLVSYISERT